MAAQRPGAWEKRMTMKKASEDSVSRRETLRLLGIGGTAALVGLADKRPLSFWPDPVRSSIAGATSLACVVRPAQTEGPYFIDERLNRADIRTDPSNNSIKDGMPLRLKFNVAKVDDRGSCSPLPRALVDFWQCDALGVYSDVKDIGGLFDTRGQKFLRGYQVTDNNGSVELTTIYPGWYPGRTVHIHFKIRIPEGSQRAREFTSQLYFHDSFTDEIYAKAPYNAKGGRRMRNEGDNIFSERNSGEKLILDVTHDAQGCFGRFDIGLAGMS